MSTQPVYSQNKEDKPLVSFIVTYYSEPVDMLKECISSILALSLNETERQIIVVDDGAEYSPINELLALSSKIVYVRQPNRGLGQARNTGIELAEGSFIQFVDGDDLLLTSAYEQCLDIIRQKQMRERVNKLLTIEAEPDLSPIQHQTDCYMELLAFVDNKLTTQTRTVFRLRFDMQLSYKAIAEQVGISEAAVYKHLIQAIRKMKEQFNPNQK